MYLSVSLADTSCCSIVSSINGGIGRPEKGWRGRGGARGGQLDVYISKCYRNQENLNFFGFGGECEKVGEDVVGALMSSGLTVVRHDRGLFTEVPDLYQ